MLNGMQGSPEMLQGKQQAIVAQMMSVGSMTQAVVSQQENATPAGSVSKRKK